MPFDPNDKSILAVGERPLLSEAAVHERLPLEKSEDIKTAIIRLLGFQCIARVYLLSEAEFIEQWVGGRSIRTVNLAKKSGLDCLQVTLAGVATLEKCFQERVVTLAGIWFSKGLEKIVPAFIAFLLGVLFSSVFGFDIQKLLK